MPVASLKMGHGERILVVDDDRAMLEALETLLMGSGFEVELADDAFEAFSRLQVNAAANKKIDLLVADYRMPVTDGLSLIKRSRQLRTDLPAILMTGCREPAIEKEIHSLGGCEYLEKPFSHKKFLKVISQLLTGSNEKNKSSAH